MLLPSEQPAESPAVVAQHTRYAGKVVLREIKVVGDFISRVPTWDGCTRRWDDDDAAVRREFLAASHRLSCAEGIF
jgi:hypothetical protein